MKSVLKKDVMLTNQASTGRSKYLACTVKMKQATFMQMNAFGNEAEAFGGAVFLSNSQLWAMDSNFMETTAVSGGALALIGCSAVLQDCHLSCVRSYHGGGALMYTTMLDDTAQYGAELSTDNSKTSESNFQLDYYLGLLKCTFENCSCLESGGGIIVSGCPDLFIESTKFASCKAARYGGGLFLYRSRTSVRSSLFYDCIAGGRGTYQDLEAMNEGL